MTREEAIRILDPVTSMDALAEIEYYGGFRGQEAVRKAVDDACILAVAALREQEERDNRIESDAVKNDPLTLDELREMDGEPVWVETGEVSLGEQIIGSWEIFIGRESAIYYFTRRKRGFFAEHYGKTWLAYRRKPKEELELIDLKQFGISLRLLRVQP